jgi:hypothetical protein
VAVNRRARVGYRCCRFIQQRRGTNIIRTFRAVPIPSIAFSETAFTSGLSAAYARPFFFVIAPGARSSAFVTSTEEAMINEILNDFSIVTGELRGDDFGYITFVKDDLARDHVEHSFFLVFHKGEWLWPTDGDTTNWTTTSLTVVKEPLEQALFIGLWGQVQRVGSGDVNEEFALANLPDGPKTSGHIRCIRAIAGRAYAAGMRRQVYRREGMDSWERMDMDVRTDLTGHGFAAIHGLDAASIYAAGLRGEIWYYDGMRWRQEDSPTKRIITDIWCSASGKVFACGLGGTVLVRSDGVWRLVDHDATVDDFWSIREFGGRVFLAAMRDLYELSGDTVVPVNFGHDAPATCFALSVAGNTMWSVGAKNIFSFDGTRWTRVV